MQCTQKKQLHLPVAFVWRVKPTMCTAHPARIDCTAQRTLQLVENALFHVGSPYKDECAGFFRIHRLFAWRSRGVLYTDKFFWAGEEYFSCGAPSKYSPRPPPLKAAKDPVINTPRSFKGPHGRCSSRSLLRFWKHVIAACRGCNLQGPQVSTSTQQEQLHRATPASCIRAVCEGSHPHSTCGTDSLHGTENSAACGICTAGYSAVHGRQFYRKPRDMHGSYTQRVRFISCPVIVSAPCAVAVGHAWTNRDTCRGSPLLLARWTTCEQRAVAALPPAGRGTSPLGEAMA